MLKNKMRSRSLELKFLIPYIISVFFICFTVFIIYIPEYKNRFLKAEEANAVKYSALLDNTISTLYSEIDIFTSYIEVETNMQQLFVVFQKVLNNQKSLLNIYYGNDIPYKDGGIFIHSSGDFSPDFDQTSRPWYKTAISKPNEITISDPYIDYVSGNLVVTFSKAMYVDGKLRGVFGVDVEVNDIINEIKKSSSSTINIIDTNGRYLDIKSSDNLFNKNIKDDSIVGKYYTDIVKNNLFSFVEGKNGYITIKANNIPWHVIYIFDSIGLVVSLVRLALILLLVLIILSGVEFVLVVLIAKPISNTLGNTIKIIESMSDGNFNTKFNDKDLSKKDQSGDFMRALDGMQSKLGDIIYNMKNNINGINDAVNIITSGSTNLSDRTNYQASALEELASSVDFVFSSLKDTAVNTNNAKNMSENVSVATKNGVDAINNASENMLKISDASRKISDITKIIESIALQTNILALNASVEAARAGDQGKGFAVVASEVRTLAINVGNAAKDISNIATETIAKIEDGTSAVEESASILRNIEVAANEVANVLIGISNSIVEEEDSLSQINTTVNELNSITQENSNIAEDGAIASRNVLTKSENIVNEVSYFRFE